MNIVRYETRKVHQEMHDTYGVVNDSGTRALRVRASDYGKATLLTCNVVYRGENLAFKDSKLSDPSDRHSPHDSQGRELTLEITPPLTDLEKRQNAVVMYASSVLGLEQGSSIVGIDTIPGNVTIRFSSAQ